MEEGAYAAQLFAALLFLIAGGRLIRLSHRTREAPERLLGLYFTLTGAAYVGWVLPLVVNMGPGAETADYTAWVVYSIGVVPYLIFTRIVFRPTYHWPRWVVMGCVAALALSAIVLTLSGDRYPGLGNPFFWIQWLGYTVPCAWMALEAMLCRRGAMRRARIGLGNPIVANRYLLLAVFGAFQVLACMSDILLALDYASTQAVSGTSDLILGACELAGIAALWLAFFPSTAYLDWVAGSKQTANEAA
ncbi:MAG: hypothetical protein JRG89_04350 [Deltaproteobacteria bacterium]|nr:hypothetical protein [Deltaproteobacteria bacterium]MBW2387647.1 hypothetical protein [Deltaproteobacteria bacterium]MBW2725832.1 hypothetical protein [Deltaproteobacteria bacterium]